ncbi:hypothetical protein [Jannaschia pohangensis]|uniref:hypothetical protein n=1 Tax=Jannaschia pohangensis TaxID=390807 RepID=UPI000B80DF47|nr:hypothetical protein [Jannaschia pohangensis]
MTRHEKSLPATGLTALWIVPVLGTICAAGLLAIGGRLDLGQAGFGDLAAAMILWLLLPALALVTATWPPLSRRGQSGAWGPVLWGFVWLTSVWAMRQWLFLPAGTFLEPRHGVALGEAAKTLAVAVAISAVVLRLCPPTLLEIRLGNWITGRPAGAILASAILLIWLTASVWAIWRGAMLGVPDY